MDTAVCHPDDLRYCPISSRWHNVIWTLSHPDELAPGRISSGWHLSTTIWHPDDISYHRMSSGWLSRNWYLIRMSYDNSIMSSGWHRLPFLSHPDEIANFDFPHHAVALQWFRRNWKQRPCRPPFLLELHQRLMQWTAVDASTRIRQRTSGCLRNLRDVTCYLPSKSEMFMLAWKYFSHHTPSCVGIYRGHERQWCRLLAFSLLSV